MLCKGCRKLGLNSYNFRLILQSQDAKKFAKYLVGVPQTKKRLGTNTLNGGELFMNYVCPIKLEFLPETFQSCKFLFIFFRKSLFNWGKNRHQILPQMQYIFKRWLGNNTKLRWIDSLLVQSKLCGFSESESKFGYIETRL